MKITAVAPANIAFIKYWGKKNDNLRLPANGSLSMSLDKCTTTTTVEFDKKYRKDSFEILGDTVSDKEQARVSNYLSRLRKMAKSKFFARVVSRNSFPKSTGIAASASGFAALSVAASSALELKLSEKKLSILARLGSGSACRSIPDGFVEWREGNSNETSFAYSIYPPSYWDLRDILLIISAEQKRVPTTRGQEASRETSIFYRPRIDQARRLLPLLKKAFVKKNLEEVGKIIEKDTINMHCVMMTTNPPLFYWSPKTLEIIKNVYLWREEGVPVYFAIDAGPNVHLICEGGNEKSVLEKVKKIKGINKIIVNKPAKGSHLINNHLF